MKKEMKFEVNDQRNHNTGAKNATRLPYTPPELSTYNQSKITMGGINLKDNDYINPTNPAATNYRS